jgi:hypothetical protein
VGVGAGVLGLRLPGLALRMRIRPGDAHRLVIGRGEKRPPCLAVGLERTTWVIGLREYDVFAVELHAGLGGCFSSCLPRCPCAHADRDWGYPPWRMRSGCRRLTREDGTCSAREVMPWRLPFSALYHGRSLLVVRCTQRQASSQLGSHKFADRGREPRTATACLAPQPASRHSTRFFF